MKQYIKPTTTIENATIAQSLLCSSSVTTINDRDFGTCHRYGHRGGNHRGWSWHHKHHY